MLPNQPSRGGSDKWRTEMNFVLLYLALFVLPVLAQDLQNRTLVQAALDISSHKYIALKSITNLKSQTPNNINLFLGIGYRGKSWSLEVMVQKQLNANGGFWAEDTRVVKKFGKKQKTTLYLEATPFFSQKGLGWSAYCETEVWKKFAVGTEIESINKPGPGGPRISHRLGHFIGFEVSGTGAFRFDPQQRPSKVTGHPHEIRFYLVFNRRVALTGRK